MKVTKLVSIGLLVILMSISVWAAGEEDLYGTWRLVSYYQEIQATGEKIDIFGKAPIGFLSYSRDGRMSAILAKDRRPKPADLTKVTDAERVELFKTVIAYAGTFKFDGKTVTHYLDISWNETWTGTAQVRNVRLEGGKLYISTNPIPRPEDGKVVVGVLVWEKVK
jgi:Lipocalin-like domain